MSGQNQTSLICPQIRISVPKDHGYFGRGESYPISVVAETENWERLNYDWTFSNNVSFEKQGKPVIYFETTDELNGLTVKASVKIDGLPDGCPNTISDFFQILYDPGVPMCLADYENLSFLKEKRELDRVVFQLKDYPNTIAYFIIYPAKKHSKRMLEIRSAKISKYLIQVHKLTKKEFKIVFAVAGDFPQTLVYVVPKDSIK